MTGNKWHLLHEERPFEMLCGRTSKDGAFTPKTARLSTTDIEQFKKRPCKACLNIIRHRCGLYNGKQCDVEDLLKKRKMGVLK